MNLWDFSVKSLLGSVLLIRIDFIYNSIVIRNKLCRKKNMRGTDLFSLLSDLFCVEMQESEPRTPTSPSTMSAEPDSSRRGRRG